MPCMGAFTGIYGRKRPHGIRRVGAWLPKAAFALAAAQRAHRSAQYAAARPAYLYIVAVRDNARSCRIPRVRVGQSG